MIDMRKFGEVDSSSCFEDGEIDILYIPITDLANFPLVLREKAAELVNAIIDDYEVQKGHSMDISKYRLNARLICFKDKNGIWRNEISVVISGGTEPEDLWIEKSYTVESEDKLYSVFKAYFMEQLENSLFAK